MKNKNEESQKIYERQEKYKKRGDVLDQNIIKLL